MALNRAFAEQGLLRRPAAALDDERRRYYRLTDFGREVARAEAARMESTLSMARAKNLIPKVRTS